MNEKKEFRRRATWMEYVIIAVLIAAAIILAMWFFGRSVANSLRVAGRAVTGDDSKASQKQSAQENRPDQTAAGRACKSFMGSQDRDAAETSVRAAEVDFPLSDDDRGRSRNDLK